MEIKDLQKVQQALKPTGNTAGQVVQLQVPLDGSLELLALGDIGLIAWRAAKNQFFSPQQAITNPEPGKQI